MPRPKFRAKVQKFWILRVTDTTLLFCSSLQWWCGPDLLQGDLSTAPSRYKALRHRSVPSSRRWSLHHLHIPDQLQHPGSLLTTAALSKAVKNSPTWRFVANCLLGGFVFHHFSRLTSSFFFSLPFSRILYSCSYPHLSLLSTKKGCPFPPPALPATSEAVMWWHLTYAYSLGCDLPHTGHHWALLSQEKEKHIYPALACLQTSDLDPPVPILGAAALVTNLCRTTHGRGFFPWLVAMGLLITCLCGSPAQHCN